MKKAIILIGVNAAVSVLIVLAVISLKGMSDDTKGKTVFMDSYEVFENFEMKKDFDKKLNREMSADQVLIDSLGRALTGAKDEITALKLKKEFTEKKLLFDEKYKQLASSYTNEVYDKLNKLVSEFGKKKQYNMILGSNGDGNVMYVDTTSNITSELIKYINSSYLK